MLRAVIAPHVALGIPRLSARGAALFRILLAAALLLLLLVNPGLQMPTATPIAATPGTGNGIGSWAVMHWVRESPDIHRLVYGLALTSALGFLAGVWTRACAAALWCSLFVLVGASLVMSGQHNWDVPLIALAGVPLAPLGDAWSIDARRGRRTERDPEAYGIVLWWVGFVLGVGYLGAAIAKLMTSGVAWVTTGAVRFHFMEDVAQAPVSWGIWIAGQERLAVLLSAAAILTEAAFILVIFCRADRLRGLIGAAGFALHLGFFIFQGVLWLPWIVLYLAFLPWERISRSLGGGPGGDRSKEQPVSLWRRWPAYAIAITYVVTAQVYASARRVEYEPLYSDMPMYSDTYPSWEVFFDRYRWSKYQTYAFRIEGDRDDDGALQAILQGGADPMVAVVRSRCAGEPPDARDAERLRLLGQRLRSYLHQPVDDVDVIIATTRQVNFASSRLETTQLNLRLGTLHLPTAALRDVPPGFDPCPPAIVARSSPDPVV